MKHLTKLTDIGSDPLGGALSRYEASAACSELGVPALSELYALKNGFIAFESALHVFPIGQPVKGYGFEQWNRYEEWRCHYPGLEEVFFFAEDIFGEQFGISGDKVIRLNPETGEISAHSDDLESWAERLLDDYNFELEYPLAREWQHQHGRLPIHCRLLPKIFFFLNGAYTADNLYALDALTGMQLRADIYNQIRDIPNGTTARLVVR